MAKRARLGSPVLPGTVTSRAASSSAAYVVNPSWEVLKLVRLAPSEGPAAGNRAHLPIDEVVAAVRRGDAGSGRVVPADVPAGLDPDEMLSVLREDPAVRDRRLIALAGEVREERERLADERIRLEREIDAVQAEKSRLRRLRPPPASPAPAAPPTLPQTVEDAAALLGVPTEASRDEVERGYRAEIARCHPDRVDGMHPEIQQRAVDLSVALNAARDLMLGRARPARAARG
jgi:DnaJ-domain-containing protein 1